MGWITHCFYFFLLWWWETIFMFEAANSGSVPGSKSCSYATAITMCPLVSYIHMGGSWHHFWKQWPHVGKNEHYPPLYCAGVDLRGHELHLNTCQFYNINCPVAITSSHSTVTKCLCARTLWTPGRFGDVSAGTSIPIAYQIFIVTGTVHRTILADLWPETSWMYKADNETSLLYFFLTKNHK